MHLRLRFLTVAILAALAPLARAGELVTLRNGYELRCDHHAQVEGRVRFYLSSSEDNYIEFAPREVGEVEKNPRTPRAARNPP